MAISDDEYMQHSLNYHPYNQPSAMSKAELRKSNKPIIEKRRRARINNCLNELKSLILDAMKKDPERHHKLEKADILEMTVKHLQSIQRQQMSSAVAADPSVLAKFQSGFTECASEVRRYICRLDGVDTGVKQRLVGHLSGCISGLNQIVPFANSAALANNASTTNASVNEDVNNNNSAVARLQSLTGLQLIPSRLPTGELAFLLPNSANLPILPEQSQSEAHRSAFAPVNRTTLRSPPQSPSSTSSESPEVRVSSTSDEQQGPPVHQVLIHAPLTVITNERSSPAKSALDFSLKTGVKRPSDTLLMTCPEPKRPLVHPTPTYLSTNIPKEPVQPPTEGSSSSVDNMWRPW